MGKKLIGTLGALVTITFITGFLVLFILNPQVFEELNNLSLSAYNLVGMKGREWAFTVVYFLTGLLNIIFCIGLLKDKPSNSASFTGKILLMSCGLIWLSFGLLPYDPTTDIVNHLLMIRLIILITASSIGLLLLGVEYNRIEQDKFLKWYTLSSAGLILLLSFLSVFVYNDITWIRTNASLTIYFVWFIVFGLRNLVSEHLQREP